MKDSKEALERLKEMPTCSECELYGKCFERPLCNELYNTIKQSLDRLEKLEQFVDIYKNTNKKFTLFIQDKAVNLPNPTLEQELLRKEILENGEK